MAGQEKSFKDLQQDERLKRLERQLKLTQVKRPNSSQQSPSTHMSISGISSIHGDNAFSDFSFCSSQASASRAGSVILASSLNLRKSLSKNLKNRPNSHCPVTSSVFEQSSGRQRLDEDRVKMPPPPSSSLAPNSHKSQTANKTDKIARATSSMARQLCLQNYESEYHSVNETYRSDHNVTVERQSPKESSRSLDTSKQQGRAWENWIVRLNKDGQIIIKGKLESGDGARSKAIKKRVSATVVLSVFNHLYRLVGDIHDAREELPEYIRGKFYNGFPTDWENVRQVWQSYVLSGYSLSFRWPTPMADSDDDLRSDVTDLTVSHLKRSKVTAASILSTPHQCRDAREMERSISKGESPKRQKATPSDITLLELKETEERVVPAPSNRSNNDSEGGNTQSRSCGRIPKYKVDIIIDNLMNKNCSLEYVEKFINAMNSFNELFALPPNVNAETAPDEGVYLNYNSNSQMDKTNNESLKHVEPLRRQFRREAAAGPLNSFSLESADSEEEPSSKHETFVCDKTGTRKMLFSVPVSSLTTASDTRYLKQKEKQNTATLSRGEVSKISNQKNQREQRPIFETTDTDGETAVSNRARTNLANNSSVATTKSRRVRHQLVATGKINEGVEECRSDARCGSDASRISPFATIGTKPSMFGNGRQTENLSKRIHDEDRQRSNLSFTNNEKNDQSQTDSPAAKRSTNLSNENTLGSTAVQVTDKSTVQLAKVAVTQKSNKSSSLSRSENTPKRHKNGQPGSDSENVNLRTSSRGRRILPPLHYWEGERLSLKGQELVYSPGADRLGSTSANSSVLKNSLISSNRTAVSEPGLSTKTGRKLTGTPTGSRDRSKYATRSTIKSTETTGGVLLEISPNRDGKNDHSMLTDRRSKRTTLNTVPEDMKGNRKTRTSREKSDSSSDDGRIPVVRQRKKRRIY